MYRKERKFGFQGKKSEGKDHISPEPPGDQGFFVQRNRSAGVDIRGMTG